MTEGKRELDERERERIKYCADISCLRRTSERG